ncbi:bifunctional diaminohydroxyphosphoribosylaminopyrimidine deaminase/5-amino-6-(5-phosphoribosylamino)uracil reductase RibD [Lachnospiraceae bacterium 48-42]|nr:bifunctional diaminohydroxyphosphoribosylaminopyrimidine deaminase/5-amino-6-(5-phosphoribosylamino)uracil reductase RibD [Dorea sp.]
MTDQDYMLRAIELAKRGMGWTNPNPMVGAVIVRDGRIIGEGYHTRCGEPHAEREAIAHLTEPASGATLYVTLEPCCHHGKTPPCTEAILEQGITRVVIGSRDPNPRVSGKGVRQLREGGIQVEDDFMKEECDRINPVFFHYITERQPYVVLKYAMTADGKIATKTGASRWITGEPARRRVQMLRHTYMGIMAGSGTVLLDDPLLNVRTEGMKSPVRIICDSTLRLPLDSQICRTAGEYPTIVACADASEEKKKELKACKIKVIELPDADGRVDLRRLMQYLGGQGIDSILLEGGGRLAESALRTGIVQEIKAFIAPKIFGGAEAKTPVEGQGVDDPDSAYMLKLQKMSMTGEDILLEYKVQNSSPRHTKHV